VEIKIEVQTAGSKLYNLHFQYPEYMHIYQYYNMNAYPYVLVQTKLVYGCQQIDFNYMLRVIPPPPEIFNQPSYFVIADSLPHPTLHRSLYKLLS
jgi:hypothetical protein